MWHRWVEWRADDKQLINLKNGSLLSKCFNYEFLCYNDTSNLKENASGLNLVCDRVGGHETKQCSIYLRCGEL